MPPAASDSRLVEWALRAERVHAKTCARSHAWGIPPKTLPVITGSCAESRKLAVSEGPMIVYMQRDSKGTRRPEAESVVFRRTGRSRPGRTRFGRQTALRGTEARCRT